MKFTNRVKTAMNVFFSEIREPIAEENGGGGVETPFEHIKTRLVKIRDDKYDHRTYHHERYGHTVIASGRHIHTSTKLRYMGHQPNFQVESLFHDQRMWI